jgi:hypothetical protein
MRSLAEEEDRATDLDSKRKALQDDRDLLQKTIYEIDEEKKRELENSCRKISKDFGAIFSTILPGVTAKLLPMDEHDLTQGLQIKVAFNNQWKESLDELSGKCFSCFSEFISNFFRWSAFARGVESDPGDVEVQSSADLHSGRGGRRTRFESHRQHRHNDQAAFQRESGRCLRVLGWNLLVFTCFFVFVAGYLIFIG